MRRWIGILLVVMLLGGCTVREQTAQETVFAMDTVMDLRLWGEDAKKAIPFMKEEITALENTWSATKQDSLVGRLNTGGAVLPQDAHSFLQRAEELWTRTNGAFDPRLGGYIRAWGFYNEEYRVPTETELQQAPAQWDLGGIVKGYAGDRLTEILDTLDIDRAILNLGGNVQTYGEKPDGSLWNIAIQNPVGGEAIGTVSVRGTAAVVTSGDYQRFFEVDGVRYHHIIDPKTGYPAESGLSSVTVICRNGLTADALSTALYVMGLEAGAEFWRQSDDFEAVFILQSGEIYATEGAGLSGCEYEVIFREK